MTAPVHLHAPAKLNLGLEVLGRRDDGFHELATIFLTVSLCDEVILLPSQHLSLHCDDLPLLPDENLAFRAAHALRKQMRESSGAKIALTKRIPPAAGLGGASSDAATTLVGCTRLWEAETQESVLNEVAIGIGSDVPFFLRGGCAIGRGRGERLEPLPLPREVTFVVVVPCVTIARKTASLYAALKPRDFSDGGAIAVQAERVRAGLSLEPELLENAFARALYERAPNLPDLADVMRTVGAGRVAISGAGPAHYTAMIDRERAGHLAARLRETLRDRARVFHVAPVPERDTTAGDYDVR